MSNKKNAIKSYHEFVQGCIPLAQDTVTEIKAGSVAYIVLEENPSTGYRWHVSVEHEHVGAVSDDRVFTESSPEMPGKAVRHVWKVKALRGGHTRIIFRSYRAWEGAEKAVDVREFRLNVL